MLCVRKCTFWAPEEVFLGGICFVRGFAHNPDARLPRKMLHILRMQSGPTLRVIMFDQQGMHKYKSSFI